MANKQYSTDMLQAGDTFVVRGRTSYPRLTHVLDGEELQEEIKRATQQGRIPTTTPHVYTTLVDATIEYVNPQAPTLAECYAAERLYTNKDGKVCYTAVRKSQTLPDFGVVNPNDYTKVDGIYLDPNKTLANGLDVKCYFRVFDTKAGMHKGISLDAIVFQEPVRYYEFSNASSQLEARGIVWTPPTGEAPVYTPNQAQGAPMAPQAPGYPVQPQQPQPAYNTPAYNAPQAQVPTNQAYGYNAQQAVPQSQNQVSQQMPMNPPQGAPMPAPQNQTPYGYSNPTAAPQPAQAQAAPMQQAQPAQQAAPQQTIGNAGGSAFDSAYTY